MKKILILALSLVMVFTFAGCANSEKQDALISYINEDLASLSELETQFLESYASVSGENYTDDETMYSEFVDNTVVLARELNDASTNIASTIEDTEILEVHKLYMETSSNYLNAVTIMIAALENQDYAQVSEANEKISKANTLGLDYKNKLNALAEEYGVVIE